MRLVLILSLLLLTACGQDETGPAFPAKSQCHWYEIGSWTFPGDNLPTKSTFSDCGDRHGKTVVLIESADGSKTDYVFIPAGYALPAGSNGGL